MCFESKKKKAAVTNEEAEQQGQQQIGPDPNTTSEPQTIRNFALAELVKRQTSEGKIDWKRVPNINRYDRTFTASVGGFELTATADRVAFRDKSTLSSKTTVLVVGGILGQIVRNVPGAVDPVVEFEEVLAAL